MAEKPMTIWKFHLEIQRHAQDVVMPRGARILSVQKQYNSINMWAQVDPEADTEPHTFRVIGTGQSFNGSALAYIGTVQIDASVWHVFEQARTEGPR